MTHLYDSVLIRGEVWRSLASLLRVYSNAASLAHGEYTAVTSSGEALLLRHKEAELEVCFQAASGDGSWRVTKNGRLQMGGGFHITGHGALHMAGGKEEELDHAAIEWVQEVTSAAATGPDLDSASAMPVREREAVEALEILDLLK